MFGQDRVIAWYSPELSQKLVNILRAIRGIYFFESKGASNGSSFSSEQNPRRQNFAGLQTLQY